MNPEQSCLDEDFDELFDQRMDDRIVDFNAFTPAINDPLVLEQCQVLGDRGLRESKAFPYMLDIAFLGAEPGNDLEPYRMADYLENFCFVVKTSLFVKFHMGCFPERVRHFLV